MDAYTAEVKEWLERRFRTVDREGVYVAHQPIYGFRRGHSEERLVERYVISYQIMKALARLRFRSLLDVGAAEGYKAALARALLGAEVRVCDLSEEACRRAREIFGIEGEPVDLGALPYPDGAFDVVLCSETLEHVPDIARATRELLRVARRAVVVTVPREAPEVIERNLRERAVGAHVHALDPDRFRALVPLEVRLQVTPMLTALLKVPFALVEAVPRDQVTRYPRAFLAVYNALVPLLRRAFDEASTIRLMRLDERLARMGARHEGMLLLLVKDEGAVLDRPVREIRPEDVVRFRVPEHRLA